MKHLDQASIFLISSTKWLLREQWRPGKNNKSEIKRR